MDRDERIALLNKFFRQLLHTATQSIESMDMHKLGIPEEGQSLAYWRRLIKHLRPPRK